MDGKLLAKNKKAYFDYEITEKYEAGIILRGAEVKSIKAGHVQLKGSYASATGGHVLVQNMHVSPYKHAAQKEYDPLRKKELLLNKKQIEYLSGLTVQQGFTLVPLEIVLKNNFIKVILGVCRGKKAHDKRLTLKKRAQTKEIGQALKQYSR